MPKLTSKSTTQVYEVTHDEVDALFRDEEPRRTEQALDLLHRVMRTGTPEKINFLPFQIDVLAAALGISRDLIADVTPKYANGNDSTPVYAWLVTVTERQPT